MDLLNPLAHPPVVRGRPTLRFAWFYHVCALPNPRSRRWWSCLLSLFDSVDPAQTFRERRFQAFDVIVVVVHLLLKISHSQTHGLVVHAEKVNVGVVKAALCERLGEQGAVRETLVAQLSKV